VGSSFLLKTHTDRSRLQLLALGADFVQLCRPILWVLAHGGKEIVRHVLKTLLADFDLTAGWSGFQNLAGVSAALLTHIKEIARRVTHAHSSRAEERGATDAARGRGTTVP
jgi:hypothetical protein